MFKIRQRYIPLYDETNHTVALQMESIPDNYDKATAYTKLKTNMTKENKLSSEDIENII